MKMRAGKPFFSRLKQKLRGLLKQGPKRNPSGRKKAHAQVKALTDKLWQGFPEQAQKDLIEIRDNPESHRSVISAAAFELARYHRMMGEWGKAHEAAVFARIAAGPESPQLELALLESDCLVALGRGQYAHIPLRKHLPHDSHLCLAMANTFLRKDHSTDEGERLRWINKTFARSGLAPLEQVLPDEPLTITNLVARPASTVDRGPLISVIVPAFRVATTIGNALKSILDQSWRNLEVIVVDDFSDDQTFEVVQEIARSDSRVRALRLENNSGAYVARNFGLKNAQGEFVTVHDADDWSHSQKLELQVNALLETPSLAGSLSAWVRCREDLRFFPPIDSRRRWVYMNASSLMLRRTLLQELGGWDRVRAGADSELLDRLRASELKLTTILPDVPLSFGLHRAAALTQQSATALRTRQRGVRREYRAAAARWHAQNARPGKTLSIPPDRRSFPAPPSMLPSRAEHPPLDLLFIMDFNLKGGAFVSTMNYIFAAIEAGKSVGIYHYRRYDLDVNAEVSDEILDLAQDGKVTRVAPGEAVHARTVLVGYPVPLQYLFDLPPVISCEHFAIITNQMNARLYSGMDVQYDPHRVSANVQAMFGKHPLWIPISDLVRSLMLKDGRYEPIHRATWNPLIDTKAWCARPIRFRRPERPQPVVGRHARDHYTKWPTSAEAIRRAYCADQPCEVRLLGGANAALSQLPSKPGNWRILPFRSVPSREFLDELDFYIHYPHEDYIEEFGRAILEAMAVGIPVILPPIFETTFGQAALYSEPAGVWPLIESLWHDEAAWLGRAHAGREFALTRGWSEFPHRLAALEGQSREDLP